jgi:alkylated DNA repair dioxygenase AlkB
VTRSPVDAPSLAWQGSLLAGGEPEPDPAFAGARRVALSADGEAWVDVVPGWLHGADTAFERLVPALRWQAGERPMYDKVVAEPRLSAWFGASDPRTWPEPAPAVAAALSARYGVTFDSFGANLYRHGRDSVAWHGDRVYREQERALVAVVTLGAGRRFLLRPKGGGPSVRLDPAAGDLLVMGGTCQRTWQHAVPKTAQPVGPRLSLTFRHRSELPPTVAAA